MHASALLNQHWHDLNHYNLVLKSPKLEPNQKFSRLIVHHPTIRLSMKKPINHLASRTERLTNYRLPFQKKLQQLQLLTTDLQNAWQSVLSREILESLQVIAYEQFTLVVSTDSHTIANHLNYNQQNLLSILRGFDTKFQQFSQLRFRVVSIKPLTEYSATNLQCNQSVSYVKNCELSESTKRNIAQLCELVTDNEPLKEALQKLIKS